MLWARVVTPQSGAPQKSSRAPRLSSPAGPHCRFLPSALPSPPQQPALDGSSTDRTIRRAGECRTGKLGSCSVECSWS